MWDAINRDVTIYIGYGFQNFEGKHDESQAAQKAIADLGKLETVARRQSLAGGVVLRKFPNHEKILVIDDAEVICGGHNWLSNTGVTP
jgi:transposase